MNDEQLQRLRDYARFVRTEQMRLGEPLADALDAVLRAVPTPEEREAIERAAKLIHVDFAPEVVRTLNDYLSRSNVCEYGYEAADCPVSHCGIHRPEYRYTDNYVQAVLNHDGSVEVTGSDPIDGCWCEEDPNGHLGIVNPHPQCPVHSRGEAA